MTTSQLLQLVSVTAAFVSGMTLYYAGLGVPREKESWKDKTPYELAAKRRQRVLVWVGLPTAVIAFVVQSIAIIWFPS